MKFNFGLLLENEQKIDSSVESNEKIRRRFSWRGAEMTERVKINTRL